MNAHLTMKMHHALGLKVTATQDAMIEAGSSTDRTTNAYNRCGKNGLYTFTTPLCNLHLTDVRLKVG